MHDPVTSTVEALLFASTDPLEAAELARAAGSRPEEVERALDMLARHYLEWGHGIRVERGAAGARLVTAPEAGAALEVLRGARRPPRLSAAALDVLAIVAYKQPVTRMAIEAIRGVSSEHVLAVLLNHGLIEDVGRAESLGRPVLYCTTPEFLQAAGLTSLAELPSIVDGQAP